MNAATDAAEVMIRRAIPADARRIAELSGVLGYPVEPELMAQRLERLTASASDVVLVAVFEAHTLVGWLHGAAHELLETGAQCEIAGLVVDPEYRKLGAGRRLVEAVEAWAAARGLEQVAVRSNIVRTESHPFYERLGYRRLKTQHAYRKQVAISDD